jgi:hypothetical protein
LESNGLSQFWQVLKFDNSEEKIGSPPASEEMLPQFSHIKKGTPFFTGRIGRKNMDMK